MSIIDRLVRRAKTEQSDVKSLEDSLNLIRQSPFAEYADMEAIGLNGIGVDAFWLRQKAGEDVASPIIYYAEIWPFKVDGQNETNCLLLTWHYDTNGNLTGNGCVTMFDHTLRRVLRNDLMSGVTTLSDGHQVMYGGTSYAEAKELADEAKVTS